MNPLNGRQSDAEQVCERCGVSQSDKEIVELEIKKPPVPKHQDNTSSGPFACKEHIQVVKQNNQCCSNPDYKVHTADADAHLVEIVECKSCNETFEFAPRPK